jgi:chitosanase
MLTETQKKTAQSILNLFETGDVLGDYGQVTVIAGDTGHLTFGRSQTTLGSGNLHALLQRYCDNGGTRFARHLSPYLPRFQQRDTTLDNDRKLHNLLRATADDPVMRDTQDVFFDEVYWAPATRAAQREGIATPLGVAVVYDGFIHGSWSSMRNQTRAQVGTVAAAGEQRWIQAYVTTRRAWLAGHRRADLRATVYRMDAFQRLIDLDAWHLELPLVVRGKEISLSSLSSLPPGCYEGPQPGSRPLALQSPMLRGLDVRLLQLGLSEHDVDIKADGIYGKASSRGVKAYQSSQGLPVTGVADVGLLAQVAIV